MNLKEMFKKMEEAKKPQKPQKPQKPKLDPLRPLAIGDWLIDDSAGETYLISCVGEEGGGQITLASVRGQHYGGIKQPKNIWDIQTAEIFHSFPEGDPQDFRRIDDVNEVLEAIKKTFYKS